MDKERYQDARPYVTKLLEISPDEALYRGLKEELDIIDENKRYIEQKYDEAVDHINNDQPELAEPIVEELLEANPYEPRYRNLKAQLKEKKRQMTQQAELERLKKEARQREKAKQNDDAQQDDNPQKPKDKKTKKNGETQFLILLVLLMILSLIVHVLVK